MRGIHRIILLLALAVSAGSIFPARADLAADLPYCISAKNEYPLDKVLEACGRVIASGNYSGGDLARAYYMRGTVNNIQKNTDQAIADYGDAVRVFPKFWIAFRDRGQMYIAQNKFQPAANDLDAYVAQKTDDWKGYYFRGVAHFALGHYATAIDSLTAGLGLAPNNSEMHRVRGESYSYSNRFDDAQTDYAAVLNAAPGDANIQADIAKLAQARKAYNDKIAAQAAAAAKAEKAFQVKLKTLGAGELFTLADSFKQEGKDDQARQAQRALVSRFPNSPIAKVAARQLTGGVQEKSGSASASAGATGSSCLSILYELTDEINKSPSEYTGGSSEVWAQKAIMRLINAVPVCRNDPSSIEMETQGIAKVQQLCRQYSSNEDCENGSYHRGHDQDGQAAVEAALQRIAAAHQSDRAGPPSAGSGICKQELDKQASVISASTQRMDSSKGSKAIFIHSMWMFSSTMDVLDHYCKGQPEYGQYAGLKSSYDKAKQSCIQISSDSGQTCVPVKQF